MGWLIRDRGANRCKIRVHSEPMVPHLRERQEPWYLLKKSVELHR